MCVVQNNMSFVSPQAQQQTTERTHRVTGKDDDYVLTPRGSKRKRAHYVHIVFILYSDIQTTPTILVVVRLACCPVSALLACIFSSFVAPARRLH